jgi:hypothetical protein
MIISRFLLTTVFMGLFAGIVHADESYRINPNTDKIGDIYINSADLEKSRKERSETRETPGNAEDSLYDDKQSFQRNMEKIEIGDKKRDVIRKMGYPDLTELVNRPQIDIFAPGGMIIGINPTIEEWTYFGPDITAVVIFQDGQVIQKP